MIFFIISHVKSGFPTFDILRLVLNCKFFVNKTYLDESDAVESSDAIRSKTLLGSKINMRN